MNVAFKQPLADSTRSLDSIAEALLLPSGIDGVYARTAMFEQVVDGLSALISRYREPDTEVLRFPPVMSRRQLEKSGYLKSFPHFLGCVSCLTGAEADIRASVDRYEAGEDWTSGLAAADLVLSPAACYPVYPLVASRGAVPAGGLLFDVACDCFRREPSKMLDRLQSFRMREYVCIGTPEEIQDFPRALDEAGRGLRRPIGSALSHRAGQRSVLRPRRQADGDEPGRAGIEIRVAHSGAFGRAADRVHELQLSPRSFRRDLEFAHRLRRDRRIPAASLSASIGWRWRCSPRTASNCSNGRRGCARR